MSDPSITVAEAFKQFSQVAVSAVGRPGSFHVVVLVSLNKPNFSFALTSMGLVPDSLKPRTTCASCDTNVTIRSEILTLAKNNLGPGSQK